MFVNLSYKLSLIYVWLVIYSSVMGVAYVNRTYRAVFGIDTSSVMPVSSALLGSAIRCGLACMDKSGCYGFNYVKVMRVCHLLSGKTTKTDISALSGTTYYGGKHAVIHLAILPHILLN